MKIAKSKKATRFSSNTSAGISKSLLQMRETENIASRCEKQNKPKKATLCGSLL